MTDPFTIGLLAGKTAFVAGGSSGINLAIAVRLAKAGASVALLARNEAKLDKAVADIAAIDGRAKAFAADVRDASAVAAALAGAAQWPGPIDVLVSGAAGNFLSSAGRLSPNAFKTVVDIDLLGTFNVFRCAFDHLAWPGASLIAISAPQGTHPQMFQAHACAAKAGINMLVKCLAMEWGPAGIRVNAISPGPIAGTEGMARLAPDAATTAAMTGRIPLRRFGAPLDIADAALFLASDAASYITGAILDCDGGYSLGDASEDALATLERTA